MNRREAGKAERRRLIIQAALNLIRENSGPGLSMRNLAVRAGVSFATPYSLFGSKHAIVVAVLQDVRGYRERFDSVLAADPVERIFAALDVAIEFYVGDPALYRTLWAAFFDASNGSPGEILHRERDALWRRLIFDAACAGAFADDIDLGLLLQQLEFTFRSVMFEWVAGEVSQERLGHLARHGYAMILLGAAAKGWRLWLRTVMLDSQRALRDDGCARGDDGAASLPSRPAAAEE
jgi:AcrR family transcriptional regulator